MTEEQILNSARQALFINHQPDSALDILLPLTGEEALQRFSFGNRRALFELIGQAYEKKGQYDTATDYFMTIADYYQAGYSQMLKGDPDRAAQCWQPLLADRPNHWCLALYGMATNTLNMLPTFLQIRNHLEADIIQLSRAGQRMAVQNILYYLDLLSDINYEAYKFAGRALFHANRLDEAGTYLLKGQKILPNDPEVYYHLGQYYHAVGRLEEARMMLHQCILISPTYTPALDLHRQMGAHPQQNAPSRQS